MSIYDLFLYINSQSQARLRDLKPVFHRRSDVIAYGNPYQKAAALVDLVSSCSSLFFFFPFDMSCSGFVSGLWTVGTQVKWI